jgi:hypothetical protein
LIQVVLGLEFVLAGLSKLFDPDFSMQFASFVAASPGSKEGILAPLIQSLVLPNVVLAAQLATFVELGAGLIVLFSAFEVARRRFDGQLGAQHGYEPAVALLSAASALALAGMSATIYLLEGGGLPYISAAYAFGSPIAIELFLVPLALGVAWLELGRFTALRRTQDAG